MAKKDLYKNAPVAGSDLRDLSAAQSMLAPRTTVVRDLAVELIEPNPFQPRTLFNDEEIEELAQAIREQGFTSRVRVRAHPEQPRRFQLVYGERRWRAAQRAGLRQVPAEIAEHTDNEMMVIALTENLQRVDLNPIEEARGFQALLDHDPRLSWSQLSELVGKKRGYVANRLELLKMPDDVQQMVLRRADSMRAAREIARLDDSRQRRELIQGLLGDELSQTDVARRVRELLGRELPPPAAASHSQRTAAEPGPTDDSRALPLAGAAEQTGRPANDADTERRVDVLRKGQAAATARATALDRQLSEMRHTLVGWYHQLDQLEPGERAKIEAFLIEELLPTVSRLVDALNGHDTTRSSRES